MTRPGPSWLETVDSICSNDGRQSRRSDQFLALETSSGSSTRWNAPGACSSVVAFAEESINGKWSGAADHEGCEAGKIEQNDPITYRSELRSRRGHGEEFN
jgi:hypothetical protein